MILYIPEWLLVIPVVYLGMGVLMWPVLMVRVNNKMSHNHGWTWKNTLCGNKFNLRRFIVGHLATILFWPFAMKELG